MGIRGKDGIFRHLYDLEMPWDIGWQHRHLWWLEGALVLLVMFLIEA